MIISLKEKSGLGLKIDIDRPELVFDNNMFFSPPRIRTIKEIEDCLLDRGFSGVQELYYMYRDVYQVVDKTIIANNKLRYDVTMITPFCLGNEYMKTAGHYHPGDFGELYEVVSGRCFCLLQRPSSKNCRIIEEVIFVEAVAGQKIVIPPAFGHVLINPGPDYLVTSNWVSNSFASRYELYKETRGAAYYVTVSGGEEKSSPRLKVKIGLIRNPRYSELPEISFVIPAKEIKRFGLVENSPMYNLIHEGAGKLDFLNHPLNYDYADVFVKSS